MQKHILRAALLLSLLMAFGKPLLASNVTLILPGTENAAPASLSPAEYPPQPALFRFKNGNSTVYLFGTVHEIVEGVRWRTHEFDTAIARADRIWLESTIREMLNPTILVDQMLSMKNKDGRRVEDILSKEEMAKLQKAARAQNIDIDEYGDLHPWVISDILQGAHYKTDIKKDPKKEIKSVGGVEDTIQAMGMGKPVLALENTRKHMLLFSQLSPDDEKALLMDTVNQIDHSINDKISADMDTWSRGDLVALDKLDDQMRKDTPGLYKNMMTERNQIMFDKIVKILHGSGTDFVAVGAGHVAGPNGLVSMLEKAGYKAERIYDTEPPVASKTEREMLDPHYRTELLIPLRLTVSLRKGTAPDEILLHFERGVTIGGCVEVSPIKTETLKSEDTIDVSLIGYFLNIHPYPNIDGCGPAVKTIVAEVPLSVTQLKKYKVHILKLQTLFAFEFYTLTYENGILTLTPKNQGGEINKTFRPDMKNLALTGL